MLFAIDGKGPVLLDCIDPFHQIDVGDTWVAAVGSLSDLSKTRLGASALEDYSEVAWLFNYSLTPGVSESNADAAMRKLLYENYAISSAAMVLYNLAEEKTPLGYTTPNVVFYSPTGSVGQEFVGSSVPEPKLVATLGVGLLLIVAARIRRKKEVNQI